MGLEQQSKKSFYLIIALLAVAGAALALTVTRYGPGAAGDSTTYLMGAENLLSGNGYSRYSGGYEIRPITGFPPMYSVALAAVSVLGIPLMDAGRWLNALIFAANIALLGAMVFWFSRSFAASALAGLLLLTRALQLELHSWVMSEPLFILFSLCGICLIAIYVEGRQLSWLIAAAVIAALATLTRFAGAALIVAGVIGALAFGPAAGRRRLRDGLLFSAVSALPVYLWLLRNRAVAGTLVNRELTYHPMQPALMRLFLADLSSWFVPHELPLPTVVRAALALLIVGGLLLATAVLLARRWLQWERFRLKLEGPETSMRALPWLLIVYAAGNLAIIWINSTLLDAATTASAPARYLAPVFVSAVALLCMLAPHLVARAGNPSVVSTIAVAYAILLVGFFSLDSLVLLRDPLPRLGYSGRRLLWPELVSHLNSVPAQSAIVSNNPEMIYILAGRPAYVRPISFDPYRGEPREDYDRQFAQLEDKLVEGGQFVVFDGIEADDRALIERFGLELLAEFPEARIYGQPNPALSIFIGCREALEAV